MNPRFRIFTYPEEQIEWLLNYIDNGDIEWWFGKDVIVEHIDTGVLILVSNDGNYIADILFEGVSHYMVLASLVEDDVKEFVKSQQS